MAPPPGTPLSNFTRPSTRRTGSTRQFGHSSLDAASEEILADDHVFLAIPVHVRDSDPENGRKLGFSRQGPRFEMIASIQIIPNRNQCRSSHANKGDFSYFFAPKMASFAALSTRNLTTRLAVTLMAWPFLGPNCMVIVRAGRFTNTSLPIPGTVKVFLACL